MDALVREHELRFFFTLTLDPSYVPSEACPWKYIPKVWGNFSRTLRRAHRGIKYVAVLEKHKQNDRPHIHGFWNRYLEWEWVRKRWDKCKGGIGCYLEYITNENISEYVSKQLEVARYVGKEQIRGVPHHIRKTLWRSNGLKAEYELKNDPEWDIVKGDIYNDKGEIIRVVTGKKGE